MTPQQRDAGDAMAQLLEQVNMAVVRSLPPDGISTAQAISEVLQIVDGPVRRIVRAEWERARA